MQNPFNAGQNNNDPNKSGSNLFGGIQQPNQSTTNNSNTNMFGSNSNLFGAGQSQTGQTTILDNNSKTNATVSSGIVGSIQDNSLNLYNLTLKEILEKQTTILDKNITEFKKSAEQVFEQDMKLIVAKTNYVNIQEKIKKNGTKMDELIEGLDFFSAELDKLDTKEENAHENTKIIAEFEGLTDKFYEQVENFYDENGNVMDLINENYELVDKIDAMLDDLESKAESL
ncbi:hypothetical protein ECANGB1_535 [Enterospora canceri]|uniref:Uncharacterized protein n=1 Tax=Enterospora canceri TaxID=1081671 RepID=A0A1Y1S7U5_9MICR|nr:hypothetical protein ECANGB1_535 [Enterospora canceri]